MNLKAKRDISRKLKVLNHALESKNVSRTCRYFGVSRESFYTWRRAYEQDGEEGLINNKPCPENPNLRIDKAIEEKIVYLRTTYHFGPLKISWYLERFHDIKVSRSGCYYILLRNRLNRLPENIRKRSMPQFKRYEKKVPGHHVQVDVKFLFFNDEDGKRIKRYQYTAIDDATRIRALKIYSKHTQANAIDFINYVVDKFPFRIKVIRTDNGSEFQAKFNWHVQDLGMDHVYIKPGTPRLNGKVERSHRTDKQEFYQLIDYNGDVDLHDKLAEWEAFYNFVSVATSVGILHIQ
ncbi:Transposase [Piscirickettsia salmonis]|uniref:IS481 family transposase n=1 Tax=Piscirickettsia salmonis TaxID=1238 RepID=UPI0012B9F7D0|nr:IS481 family transposase [Piscirickettsia salmonis]QGP50870.1 Transposase [Piscirickettsia salmonis]QGP53182.1 Transposase [Piscirickettsia salmonis]